MPLTLPKGIALGGNEDSQEAKMVPAADESWRSIVSYMLTQGLHGMTEPYLRLVPIPKPSQAKAKKAMWSRMAESGQWRRCYSPRATHMLIPLIRTQHTFAEAVPTPNVGEPTRLQEAYDLAALRSYTTRSEYRLQNDQLFTEPLTRPRQVGRGRRKSDMAEVLEEMDDLMGYLVENERILHNFQAAAGHAKDGWCGRPGGSQDDIRIYASARQAFRAWGGMSAPPSSSAACPPTPHGRPGH